MARIRTIKPDFFRHEGLHELECACMLPIRVAFAGLWTVADREGRFQWRPRVLKLDVLPFDNVDFSAVLDALASAGFIVKYEKDGELYGVIPSWAEHQNINKHEAQSRLPDPSTCNKVQRTEMHMHARGEGKGREGEKEGNSSDPDGSDADDRVDDPIKTMFDSGVNFMTGSGVKPDHARSLIGKARKHLGDDGAQAVVQAMIDEAPSDPKSWLSACVVRGPPNGIGRVWSADEVGKWLSEN